MMATVKRKACIRLRQAQAPRALDAQAVWKVRDDFESAHIGSDAAHRSAPTAAELAAKVFAGKARRRSWLASLPVEEKYRRFLQLQRMVCETLRAAGKPTPTPWPEDRQ